MAKAPTHAQVAANNEAIHQALISEQCLLIEKAEEIYNATVRDQNPTQYIYLAGWEAKRWVRQIHERYRRHGGGSAQFQWERTACGPGTGPRIYNGPQTQPAIHMQKNNLIDNWNWMSLHEINSNFDYVKIHSFGGPINFMGNWRPLRAGNAISGGPGKVPDTRNLQFFHPFFEITPEEKAQIAHFCNVKISYYDEAGQFVDERDNVKSTVVPFNQNGTDLSYLTRQQSVRQLAGLQSVTITHEGIDSLTKNVVLINATYIFQDLRKLVEQPFSQLLQLGNWIQSEKLFRYVEFELGWDTSDPALKTRLQLDKLKLKTKANLLKYTFDLKEDGSMVVNATYRGAVVDVAHGPYANILQLSKTVFEEVKNNTSEINRQARANAERQGNVLATLRAKQIADNIMTDVVMENYSQFITFYQTRADDRAIGDYLGEDSRGDATPESVRRKHGSNWYVGPAMMPTRGTVAYDDYTGFSPDRMHFKLGTYGEAHSALDRVKAKMESELENNMRALGGLNAEERELIMLDLNTRLEQFFEGGGANGRDGMRALLQKLPSFRGQSGVDTSRGSNIQIGFTDAGPSDGLRDSSVSGAPGPTGMSMVGEWAGNRHQYTHHRGAYYLRVKNELDNWMTMNSAADATSRHRENQRRTQEQIDNLEDGVKQSYQAAAANAVTAAYKARFIALRYIAKSLLENTDVYSMYINKSQRVAIKEASLHDDKQVMIDALAALEPVGPDGYLTVRNPSGIRLKHKQAGNDRDILEAYKNDGANVEVYEFTENDLEEYQVVPFVFLGDLLMSLLTVKADLRDRVGADKSTILPKEKIIDRIVKNSGRRFYTDLGLITYNKPFTNQITENFKLYYYPISVKRLNDFFSREILGKERQFYSYYDFCQDLIRKFLDNSFTACAREAHMQSFVSPKVRMALFDHPGQSGSPAGSIPGGEYPGSSHIFIWGSKNVKYDLAKHAIMKNQNFGDYAYNMLQGIYHFYLGGLDRGMALSVKVIDIADTNAKTAVYYNAGRSSERSDASANSHREGDWAPVIFQANIETLGYPLFELGNLIYVDLSPYVTNEHRQMRQFAANGYYGVKKITYNWSESKFTTEIESIIQYSNEDAINVATGVPLPGRVKDPGMDPTTIQVVQETSDQVRADARRTQPALEQSTRSAERALKEAEWRRPPEN